MGARYLAAVCYRSSSRVHEVGPDGYLTCRPIESCRGLGAGVYRVIPGATVSCHNCLRRIARRNA